MKLCLSVYIIIIVIYNYFI